MTTENLIRQLKNEFHGKEIFSRDQLYEFYRKSEPNLKETTFSWRIFNLKKKGVIRSVSKSEFSLSYKPVFKPQVDRKLADIFKDIQTEFPHVKHCVWSSGWIVDFMLHIPPVNWNFVEVEKNAVDSVFSFLQEKKIKSLFIRPSEKEMNWYLNETKNATIVRSLVSLAPIQKSKNVKIPTLEKLLLDTFVDENIFTAFQGQELAVIFNNAYQRYQINFSKMIAYAKRRGREQDLLDFIIQKTDIPETLFI